MRHRVCLDWPGLVRPGLAGCGAITWPYFIGLAKVLCRHSSRGVWDDLSLLPSSTAAPVVHLVLLRYSSTAG